MSFDISIFSNTYLSKRSIDKILVCNDITQKYGLVLTEKDVVEITTSHNNSLSKSGQVEFTDGIIDKIIFSFCNSPFISQDNFKDTIEELLDLFYQFKNETLDLVSDDELIEYMEKSFNNSCKGSLELLSGRELAKLAKRVKNHDYGDDVIE